MRTADAYEEDGVNDDFRSKLALNVMLTGGAAVLALITWLLTL